MKSATAILVASLTSQVSLASTPVTVPVPAHLAFAGYAAGLNVMDLTTDVDIEPNNYRVDLAFHTTGVISVIIHGTSQTSVTGAWLGDQPKPAHYDSHGIWRGDHRATVIDYAGGQPVMRSLVPANDREREPVPPDMQRNTVDNLSAMAMLVRNVADTGRCDGDVTLFDGRRVARISAHTVGVEVLPHESRSTFSGNALRCDFVGQQLAGFMRDADPSEVHKPIHGTAWLAHVIPGAPALPVRLTFETRFVGHMTMYLTAAEPTAPAVTAGHSN